MRLFFVLLSLALALPVHAQEATDPSSTAPPLEEPVEEPVEDSPDAAPTAASTAAEEPTDETTEEAAPDSGTTLNVEVSFVARSGGETPVDPDPPTRTGVPWLVELAMQVFGRYEVTFPDGADWFHEIDLPRSWIGTSFRVENAIGRVLLEGTRAGGDGSLIGVGGDSLVVRFREAWLGYRLFDLFEARGGLIPQLTTPALTSLWGMRALRAISLRELELMQPADLGASLRFDIPEHFGFVAAAFLSGEGYRSRELNRGKTWEITAQIHPLAFVPELRPLAVTLAYQSGSTGTGSARADRFVAGVAWADPRWGLGVETAYVLGIEDRSEREGLTLDAWGRLEPIEHLLLAARYSHFFRNLVDGPPGDEIGTFTGSVGAWIIEAIRVFVAFDARYAGAAAQSELPGFSGYSLRLVLEGNLGARFEGTL